MLNQLPLPLNLSVRPALESDQPFFKVLFRASRPHLQQIDMPEPVIHSLVDQQYQLQQAHYREQWPDHSSWVIERCSKAVGGITLNHSSPTIHLLDLTVGPEHQGQQVGSNTLKALQKLATANNQTLQLSVDRQNKRARKLYAALGFHSVQTTDTHKLMIWEPRRAPETE